MEFNLERILKALLLSTNEPLSIKDIQAVITRYHDQLEAEMEEEAEEEAAAASSDGVGAVSGAAPGAGNGNGNGNGEGQALMRDILAEVPSLLTSAQIRDAMDRLASELIENDEVYRLVEGPNGYRIAVAPDYAEWVRLLRDEPRPQKLRAAALETLAIVAYRQPVTRAEIEAIRGVSADSALNKLMEKELVYVVGRAELPGRPIQYGTTETFLEFCGLRSLEELPASDVLSPNQITEWIRKATMPEEELSDKDVGLPESSDH